MSESLHQRILGHIQLAAGYASAADIPTIVKPMQIAMNGFNGELRFLEMGMDNETTNAANPSSSMVLRLFKSFFHR